MHATLPPMILVLNWKMNPNTLKEAFVLLAETKKGLLRKKITAIVAPPSVFLADMARKKGTLHVAAQHIHAAEFGSHTGDIAASQVVSVGARYVLIGHAERRALGETNEDVGKKVVAALAAHLVPIVCIGEGARDAQGHYLETIKTQLEVALRDVLKTKAKQLLIAYEPVWAIGATKPMSTHEMHEMTIYIRKLLFAKFGKSGMTIPVLYGGSIDGDSAHDMMHHGEVDGLLVGRASSDATKMRELFDALK